MFAPTSDYELDPTIATEKAIITGMLSMIVCKTSLCLSSGMAKWLVMAWVSVDERLPHPLV